MKANSYYLERIQRATAFESLPEDMVFARLARASDFETDLSVDGSGSDQNFDYVVPQGTVYKRFLASRLNMYFIDGSIVWNQFLGLGAVLANGIIFQAIDELGVVRQGFGTDIVPLTESAHFSILAGIDTVSQLSAGDDVLPVRWTIEAAGNQMTMFPGWTFRCVIRDNLTAVTEIGMELQGVLRKS